MLHSQKLNNNNNNNNNNSNNNNNNKRVAVLFLFIFDRTISDVMDFTKLRGYESIRTAIDFEIAFDSLNWNFLFTRVAGSD